MKARECGAAIIFEPKSEAIHHESYTLKNTKMSHQDKNNYNIYRKKWDKKLVPKKLTLSKVELSQEGPKYMYLRKGNGRKESI